MFYGGREEPENRWLTLLSCAFAVPVAIVIGYVGFLLATAFPAMIATALPSLSRTAFLVLWTLTIAVPVLAFRRVLVQGKGLGARVFATVGIAMVVGSFAGEVTGQWPTYPWNLRFVFIPGEFDPWPTPSPIPPAHRLPPGKS